MEGDTSHADQHSELEGACTGHRGTPPWLLDQRKWGTHHQVGKDTVPVLSMPEARVIRHQVKPLEEVAADYGG